ncbi:hypothetical protein GCM10010383_50730 [Streptomyces lomondensis]|uniref:Uncharacterized protein n=1 Tax=Streptomyces lomondensis TaxID=68229 RepID=A0ABQ2XFV5_9ACTN|nr:hypothetical protein GCM10010383_50730 [Streptomyces lomondensis]
MSTTDPHIHVEQKVVRAGPGVRNLLVSTLGRAPDAPGVVTTGCGQRVPYAMTSARPESVTCLACREHAHREYLRVADQVERLGSMPGTHLTGDQTATAAARLRDLAGRFSGSGADGGASTSGARPAQAGHCLAIDEARPSVRSRTCPRAAPAQAGDATIPYRAGTPGSRPRAQTVAGGTDNGRAGDSA